jgi:membrane protein YqaA with SNARE-associated domain
MLRRAYDWTMRLAAHHRAGWALAVVAFLESSVFPIPPDALLVPMGLANRHRVWWYATIATLASVLGGMAGYAIGYFLFDTLGRAILDLYGMTGKFAAFTQWYNENGAAIVLFAGITPFPYKVITIASGVTGLDLLVFTLSSVVARGLRFYLLAALLWWFGPAARRILERYLGWITLAFGILLVGGFLLLKYL